jgi:hypothetical protein
VCGQLYALAYLPSGKDRPQFGLYKRVGSPRSRLVEVARERIPSIPLPGIRIRKKKVLIVLRDPVLGLCVGLEAALLLSLHVLCVVVETDQGPALQLNSSV